MDEIQADENDDYIEFLKQEALEDCPDDPEYDPEPIDLSDEELNEMERQFNKDFE